MVMPSFAKADSRLASNCAIRSRLTTCSIFKTSNDQGVQPENVHSNNSAHVLGDGYAEGCGN